MYFNVDTPPSTALRIVSFRKSGYFDSGATVNYTHQFSSHSMVERHLPLSPSPLHPRL